MIDDKFRDEQKTLAALAFFWAKVQSDPSIESPLLSLLADDRAIAALVEIDRLELSEHRTGWDGVSRHIAPRIGDR